MHQIQRIPRAAPEHVVCYRDPRTINEGRNASIISKTMVGPTSSGI